MHFYYHASWLCFKSWFNFFLNFCCLITLLKYLVVKAGAGAGTGAGAGVGVGAGAGAGVEVGAEKKHLYEDWPCPLCGVWVETCHLWISEKEEKLYQLLPKKRLTEQSLINLYAHKGYGCSHWIMCPSMIWFFKKKSFL